MLSAVKLVVKNERIDAGIILGRGQTEHYNYLVYAHCARKEVTQYGKGARGEGVEPHERVWKWRLFYNEYEKDPNFVYNMVFESIVDWLAWYREWYHRFIADCLARWAQLMREVEWHAAGEKNLTGDMDAL